jgi:hypothetical protein
MSGTSGSGSYDRRIGDWLEEGPQGPPDWLVDGALEQAGALPQLRGGPRLPRLRWPGGRIDSVQALISVAAGALAALAVVAAFGLGLLSGQVAGIPSPSPTLPPSPSPSASALATPFAQSISRVEVIDVLPGEGGDFYTLIGLAATRDAVWTVAVTADPECGGTRSVLLRVDATSGEARVVPIESAVGMLSPPAADNDTVWTASAGGLHTVEAVGGTPRVTTVPLEFVPGEIAASENGLWIAHEDGTSLVDPATGEVLRRVTGAPGSGRIAGAPAFGSLWSCAGTGGVERIDAQTGETVATVSLPPGVACRGSAQPVLGVRGLPDSVLPGWTNVLIDPATNAVSRVLDGMEQWTGAAVVDESLWLAQPLRGGEPTIGLIRLDPATGRADRVLTVEGAFHLNTQFQSGSLALTADYLWLLADGPSDRVDGAGPRILRIARSEFAAPGE